MKVNQLAKYRRDSKNSKRRYTMRDMAIIKHDAAVLNAQEKRGEIKRTNTRYITICGCGVEGCFLHLNIK